MRAVTRAHSRDVSTSSAATTHCGGFLASAESGKMANRAPRAPANSVSGRRFPRGLASVSCMPMCDSSPESRDMCTRSASSAGKWLPASASRGRGRSGPPVPAAGPPARGRTRSPGRLGRGRSPLRWPLRCAAGWLAGPRSRPRRSRPAWMPRSAAACRSWPYTSCHSRTRR